MRYRGCVVALASFVGAHSAIAREPATLWRELAEATDAGVRGGSALRTIWPATVRTVRDIAPNSGVNRWEGGARKLSSTVTMSRMEVRTDLDDNVIVTSGRIEGRCVSRAEVMKYYPALDSSGGAFVTTTAVFPPINEGLAPTRHEFIVPTSPSM